MSPTPNDYSNFQFGQKANDGSYTNQNGENNPGEYGQVNPDSTLPTPQADNYPNPFGYAYDANNREFSRDKAWEPQSMAEEASGSAFAELQKFLNNSPYLPGSRVCHELDEQWTSPHDAAPGTGDGKTGPA